MGGIVESDIGGNDRLSSPDIMPSTVMGTILLDGYRGLEYYSFWGAQLITFSSFLVVMFAKNTRANGA